MSARGPSTVNYSAVPCVRDYQISANLASDVRGPCLVTLGISLRNIGPCVSEHNLALSSPNFDRISLATVCRI